MSAVETVVNGNKKLLFLTSSQAEVLSQTPDSLEKLLEAFNVHARHVRTPYGHSHLAVPYAARLMSQRYVSTARGSRA